MKGLFANLTVDYESCIRWLLLVLEAVASPHLHRVTPTVKVIGAGGRRDGDLGGKGKSADRCWRGVPLFWFLFGG